MRSAAGTAEGALSADSPQRKAPPPGRCAEGSALQDAEVQLLQAQAPRVLRAQLQQSADSACQAMTAVCASLRSSLWHSLEGQVLRPNAMLNTEPVQQ